jgi:hypothetical protein
MVGFFRVANGVQGIINQSYEWLELRDVNSTSCSDLPRLLPGACIEMLDHSLGQHVR